MRKVSCFIVALIFAAISAAGFAQSNQSYQQRWLFASDFGQWTIHNQTASTYSWSPSSICLSSANGSSTTFVPFNTNAPVEIVDLTNPTQNEVKTPSAVSYNASVCSIGITPTYTHYSFYVQSGTAGLQEAINSVSPTAPYPTLIWIDRNWYSMAWNVPGTIPAAIIASAAGNNNAVIVDNTTAPFTYWVWNGTSYAASGATTNFPNQKVSSYTNIAAPTALSTSSVTTGIITTSTTGGTIPASSTYRLAATYVDASGGETTVSIDTASTATIATGSGTATNTITVTSPAAATGAVGWRLYMTAASGSTLTEILYSPTCSQTTAIANQSVFPITTVCPIGASATISAIITGTATVPAANSAFPRTTGASESFPPFPALGTIASTNTGTLALVNIPAGFMNTLGRSFMTCGNGYATTNGTGGTITLKATVASIPGVTSITPFTVVSPSIAASAIQVPINFCIDATTAATGTSGTLEVHGWVDYGVAGTAVGSLAQDTVFTVSSAIDLTKQDQITLTITPTTAGLTAAQIRQLTVYPSN